MQKNSLRKNYPLLTKMKIYTQPDSLTSGHKITIDWLKSITWNQFEVVIIMPLILFVVKFWKGNIRGVYYEDTLNFYLFLLRFNIFAPVPYM